MSTQPSNEECADIFRVMMTEMIKMHPLYTTLENRIRDLRRYVKNSAKLDRHVVQAHLNVIVGILDDYRD